jgi:putative oxidoreductase
MNDYESYAPTVLRALLGLLFLVPGVMKLMNPPMIIGMLGSLGFPAAGFFGWLLILVEIAGGVALLAGWKVKYAVWPLAVVLLVAMLRVHIPGIGTTPMAEIVALFHLVAIGGLVSVFLSGSGALAVEKTA